MPRTALLTLALLAAAPTAAHAADTERPSPFRGLAAWVDIFDRQPWTQPERAVRGWSCHGVRTLYVQTSNHSQPRAIFDPKALDRLLAAAHRRDMQVVAWYLPGFADPARDWQRTRAALAHRSPTGHRFDGFALDIEADVVRHVPTRSARMLALSSKLRRHTELPLGAIIPDPVRQRYWPGFPYAQVNARYDAILPMSYWTPAGHPRGERAIRDYTRRTLRAIRARTGERKVPVHVIGGIADAASVGEVRGFARAAVAGGAAGASLYDAPITSPAKWRALGRVGGAHRRKACRA